MEELKPRGHTIHGLYANNKTLFNTWQTMKGRCENPKREKYKDYGGRGIKVCAEWQSAEHFVRWALSNGYSEGLQLDRIDNNGDYCPENCRFVTPKENSRNKRNNKHLTINGETKCVAEWSEIVGISQFTIYWWMREKGRKYAEQRIEAWNRRVSK